MKITKGIITSVKKQSDLIVKKFNFKKVKELNNSIFYEGVRVGEEGEEKIILAYCSKVETEIVTTIIYLLENYLIDKFFNIGVALDLSDGDMKNGDVSLPNTFLQENINQDDSESFKNPIFLESSVGENYDLSKFGLILNGVCLTGEKAINDIGNLLELRMDYGADLYDREAYTILSLLKEYDKLDKCVVIKGILDGNNDEDAIGNSISVLDFVL